MKLILNSIGSTQMISPVMMVYQCVSCPCSNQYSPQECTALFIHILLTRGRYITEPDALHHSSPRDILESAQLIGKERDEESVFMYSTNLFRLSGGKKD